MKILKVYFSLGACDYLLSQFTPTQVFKKLREKMWGFQSHLDKDSKVKRKPRQCF